MEVTLVLPVRTYDIDFAGVVSNIVYIRWLEDLRMEWLNRYLPLDEQLQQDCVPFLSSIQIQYRRPIRLFDQPVGNLWMKELGRVRWTVEAEILLDEVPAATAVQTGAFVNRATMRVVSLPEVLVADFARQSALTQPGPGS
jgi:acyl-CoA thioester hydrolase